MNLDNRQFKKQLYLVTLLNFVIVLFIAAEYVRALEDSTDFLPKIYFFFATVSHFFSLVLVPLLLALLVFLLSKSKLVSKIIFVLLSVLLIIILKTDALIFGQFRYHLSPVIFSMMFGKRASDIFQFSTYNVAMAIGFIVLVIGSQILLLFIAKKILAKNRNLWIRPTITIFIFALLFTNLLFAWGDANYYRPIMQYKKTFPAFYPLTADNLMMSLNLVDKEKIKRNESITESTAQNPVKYPLNTIVSEPKNIKKNILFLIIDSWRFDCLTKEITPNLYNFSHKSQQFLNHKSGANMTTGGIFTLFYGIPATYFLTFSEINKSPVLMDELQRQHYDLGIFASSTLENPPFNRNVFANIPNLRLESKGNTPADRDLDITNDWMSKIDKGNTQPFFGYLFFDSAHGFDYPKNYKTVFNPSLPEVDYLALKNEYEPTLLINRYKNSLYYIDSLIGRIISQLEQKKLLDNTIIVITGDHGQEFNDNKKGYWEHGGNFSKYQIQVPMLVYDASKQPKTYSHLTLHYDIAPTLLTSVLGVKNPLNDYTVGQDLYDTHERDWFVCGYNSKYSVIEKDRITDIYESGLFDVVDLNLNPMDVDMNYDVIARAFEMNNKFYVKANKK